MRGGARSYEESIGDRVLADFPELASARFMAKYLAA